jgi:hypothetical protein
MIDPVNLTRPIELSKENPNAGCDMLKEDEINHEENKSGGASVNFKKIFQLSKISVVKMEHF